MPDTYFGKYTGTVVDNLDAEKLGRLKVSVPDIFPEQDTVEARAALPYGFFFVPEVDMKVWVEFEGGNTAKPIWTGMQFFAGEWPPEAEADPPQKRVIKTAAGHLIVFQDKSGEESIEIKDGVNGHTITLDKDGIKVTDGANQHSVSFAAGGVTLESGADLTIKGKNITIEAETKLTLKGPEVNVEATAKLTAKGNPIHLNP
jgi:uncharacterized protein involved in type VI secretion and phage assembly